MTRVWKDRVGPWGEAQKILHVEASAVLDLLKAEIASVAPNQRVIESRLIAMSHAREAMGYLLLGEVPTAANHLVAADAWRALALMSDDDHDALARLAEAGVGPGPLVTELRKSGDLILGQHCGARTCREPGHEPGERRCLGLRNGLHTVLAHVPRPAAGLSHGPVRAGPIHTWRPT